jgi:hypothetical protein
MYILIMKFSKDYYFLLLESKHAPQLLLSTIFMLAVALAVSDRRSFPVQCQVHYFRKRFKLYEVGTAC